MALILLRLSCSQVHNEGACNRKEKNPYCFLEQRATLRVKNSEIQWSAFMMHNCYVYLLNFRTC